MMRSGGRECAEMSEIAITELQRDTETAPVKSASLAGTASDSWVGTINKSVSRKVWCYDTCEHILRRIFNTIEHLM